MKTIAAIILGTFVLSCSQMPSIAKFTGSTESERINAFFEASFDELLATTPENQTYLGLPDNRDKLNDRSEEADEKRLAIVKRQLSELKAFDYDKLDEQAQLSYELFKRQGEKYLSEWEWRKYKYPVEHLAGIHSNLPSFMINMHKVKTNKDLDDYLARLQQIPQVLDQVIARIDRSEKLGVVPPKFVIEKIQISARNVIEGAPFDPKAKDSPLLADFKNKLKSLKDLKKGKRQYYQQKIIVVLTNDVGPAYQKFINRFEEQKKVATNQAGVWKFSKGDDYYKFRLKYITTTNYSPAFIHKLGLLNVDRIHGEMREIMKKVKYKGSLQDFFKYMKTSKKFYFPQNASGRQAYLRLATRYINDMRARLDELFITKPKAAIEVKAVEPYREKTGGSAFYEGPAPDGSRPGRYYVNLSNLKTLPKWEAESIAYHEGVPGHHMQIAIAQEMKSLPKFRRHGHYTAYVEGWGLYSERIPKEIGFYKDPYSDFGRLVAELWRACRLVVDSGLHSKKWTREQAIKYFKDNMPIEHEAAEVQIDRYIVWPGQATAYMVGMLKILELRRRASMALKDKFDLKEFHDVVLRNGAVPLDMLENLVTEYITKRGGTLSPGLGASGAKSIKK